MNHIINYISGAFQQEFTAISMVDAIVSIALSFVLGLFVVWVYKITYGGVCYSKSFAGTLIMLSMVTSSVILVISSNVVLSLGMVGALSIVRFRTAIKEPSDTAFAFWALATGIVCGAGYVIISCLMTLLLGFLFILVHMFGQKLKKGSYLVVVRYQASCQAEQILSQFPGYVMKNKNLVGASTELVAEMVLTSAQMKELEAIRNEPGVEQLSIMRSVNGSVL